MNWGLNYHVLNSRVVPTRIFAEYL